MAGWFGNKQNANAEMEPVSKVRGVPDAKADMYIGGGSTFRCFDGRGEIPVSSVNDGYCDCSDFSDEPGTAACANSNFACVNSGYRIITIPSSRVDDGICDCCDGSDEGKIRTCPNICAAIAKPSELNLREYPRTSKQDLRTIYRG